MHAAQGGAFEAFASGHAAAFRRIAAASRGEFSSGDVCNEAWLLALEIGERRGQPLDLGDPDDAALLIRYLYNHCVKYTERVIRNAVRLDHAARGDDDRNDHWLNDRLAADDGAHPASLLEGEEAFDSGNHVRDPYHSPAAAWLSLIQRFDRSVHEIAAFLLISTSWCYDRIRTARQDARAQWPLPHGLQVGASEGAIQPWRTFKLPPRAAPGDVPQLALDYWSRPAQPATGQQWLL